MTHKCTLKCLKDYKHIWELHKAKVIIGVIIIGSIIEGMM